MKNRILSTRNSFLLGCITLILLLLIVILVNSNDYREKFHVVDGLTIEQDAQIIMSKKADLSGFLTGATIALVNLPLISNQDYSGYLGIWNSEGKLIQKFNVEGYIMSPVQILVNDITGDGHLDIVLETDQRANGGLGSHALHIYVQGEEKYTQEPLPLTEEGNDNYSVIFHSSSNDFMMVSTKDSRRWKIELATDTLKELNSNLLNKTNLVNIDPISSVDVHDNMLTTKRLMWFGNVHLNSLVVIVTTYQFEDHKWVIQDYDLEAIDEGTIITEVEATTKSN